MVAEVGSGLEVVPAARANQPDIALLDIEMPA
jgi:CheY-like chemotaxis protein